ncbi:MAG: hypothetical protein ACI8WB_005933, partial [Phenylobacterium sp.]
MKNKFTAILLAITVTFSAQAAQSVNYKLITVASYLNF